MAIELYHGGPVQGCGKLFIKPYGHPEADWQELSNGGLSSSDLIIEESEAPFDTILDTVHEKVEFSFTVRLNGSAPKRLKLQLKQEFGFAKKPKCTYKTIKRNCAKRNKYQR